MSLRFLDPIRLELTVYQILDSDVKLAPGLALEVTVDRTIRFVRFSLPDRAPAIPFNRSGSASYAPNRADLSQHIHDDGTEEIKIDFFATLNSSTTLKSTWINRRHPDRENPFSDETDAYGIIEDLPEPLRISVHRVIYGEPKLELEAPEAEPSPKTPTFGAAKALEPARRDEKSQDGKIHIVRNGFNAAGKHHDKVLYIPELILFGKTVSNVYLTREFAGGESYIYSVYDEHGHELGALFESVDGLGDEYLAGMSGTIKQFEALHLVNRTGYNSPVGKVVQARGPLRTLTGYGF